MFKRVSLLFILSIIALVGCGKDSDKKTANQMSTELGQGEAKGDTTSFYDDPERGIRVISADGWFIEKETETSVKFKSEKLVAIISVIPKGKTVAEIKQELVNGAGKIQINGEGPNLISWKSERKESISTNVYIEEKEDHNVIITIMTPSDQYENNLEKIEAFRWNIELY
jgi:hypothetical protein